VLVDVAGRSLTLDEHDLAAVPESGRRRTAKPRSPRTASMSAASAAGTAREVDLHGLTVEEALARSERALNEALLADIGELRLIHGKSGGRIRDALHRWLSTMPVVPQFRLDPRNAGVTVVTL
jgi:DNA mismatch repair protein MutS2